MFCTVTNLFYQFYFFNRISSFKPETKVNFRPPVSVVVCARDELMNLKQLIPLLCSQEYPAFEIIIVDDRSEDEQYDFLLEQKAIYPKLKLVRINYTPDHINSKKYALTMGIRAASYEYLLFTDADCLPNGNQWIESMAKYFSSGEEIILGYAPYKKYAGFLNLLIRYDTFFTAIQYFSFALAGLPYMGVGRNLAYKQSLFLKLKGFYKHISITGGDDDLFVNRAARKDNVAVCLENTAYTYSEPKHSFKDWYVQKRRHFHVGKYYKKEDKINIGLIHASNLGFYVCLVPLFFSPLFRWYVLGTLLFKWLIQIWIMSRIKKVIHEKIALAWIPFLDLVHTILIFVFGIPALISKKVHWK